MIAARTLMVSLYGVAYAVAVFAGVNAADAGDDLYAVGMFTTSVGLLLGIHREARHAVRLVQVVAAFRHGGVFPGSTRDLAAIEYATALPPGCYCETWWMTCGGRHDPRCPAAHFREDS